jgi:hypothetical protein
VNRELRRLLDDGDGVVHRDDAPVRVAPPVVDPAVRSGRLRRVCPLEYADTGLPASARR